MTTALFLPLLLGLPLTTWGGMLLGLLLVFQLMNGLRVIKVPPGCHKATAIAIVVLGLVHAVVGIGAYVGWF